MKHRCIVKLITSYYGTKRGLFESKSLQYVKRLSYGVNILQENESCTSAKDVVKSIVNLQECTDGLYEAILINLSYDYETGYCDDYDLKLIPFLKDQYEAH